MEHPGIDIVAIKRDMTLEELQAKVTDLHTRMGFAYQTNNQPMMHQLEMMLEVYTRAQMEVLDEMFKPDPDGPDLGGKIDVS